MFVCVCVKKINLYISIISAINILIVTKFIQWISLLSEYLTFAILLLICICYGFWSKNIHT